MDMNSPEETLDIAITFLSESRNGAVNELGFHERRGASSED